MSAMNLPRPTWDEGDSTDFIDWGHYFVPNREQQIDVICRVAGSGPPGGDFVELCCGQGLLSKTLLERFPGRRVHALDGSLRMMEAARETVGGNADRFDVCQFDLNDASWRRFRYPVAAVVSSLAVHHLDGPQKQHLFADVAAGLMAGGVLVLADVVMPAGEAARALAAAAWEESVRQRSLELHGDLRALERFRALGWNFFDAPYDDPMDKPSRLSDQLRWLEEAGFAEVDVYWMQAGHAIYGGRRT
jgi:tRNA (cmo5U34)-methyltransferase